VHKDLKELTREQLENKLIHMTSFIAFKLASEYIERTEPTAKVIRTIEAEEENDARIADFMVCCYPAWDVIEKTHPGYEVMRDWVKENHSQLLIRPCTCEGCKGKDKEVKA
jgi:hypothetical protein